MPHRTAEALWTGTLTDGSGTMTLGSGVLRAAAYSRKGRFEEDGGTTPEELIAAAHAGCFTMAFSGELSRAGFTPTRLHTSAKVDMRRDDSGVRISEIHLETEGEVPGIDAAKFQELAENARKGCPVSKALAAVETISLTATLK